MTLARSVSDWLGPRLAKERPAEVARATRRMHAVGFYTGKNGSAKSMCAVYDTLPDLDAGTPVLSTIRLQDFRNPRPCEDEACTSSRHGLPGHLAVHPAWVPWSQMHGGGGWEQFLEFRNGVILADEVTGIADAHEWASIPVQVSNHWGQLRRKKVTMRMTGLDFVNLNKRLRQAVNQVTRCRSAWPVTELDEDGKELIWRPRRMSSWTTYDAQSLPKDEQTDAAYEKGHVFCASKFWIPQSLASLAYDTLEEVGVIETVNEKGDCAHCGGARRQPACSCPDYTERRAAGRAPDRKRSEDRRTATGPRSEEPAQSPRLLPLTAV